MRWRDSTCREVIYVGSIFRARSLRRMTFSWTEALTAVCFIARHPTSTSCRGITFFFSRDTPTSFHFSATLCRCVRDSEAWAVFKTSISISGLHFSILFMILYNVIGNQWYKHTKHLSPRMFHCRKTLRWWIEPVEENFNLLVRLKNVDHKWIFTVETEHYNRTLW